MLHNIPGTVGGALSVMSALAYFVMVAAWYFIMFVIVVDGFFRELVGHSHGSGHQHSRLHRVIWQAHTGLPVNPLKSHGDEKRLKRVAGPSNRATPEGSIVYFTHWSRWQRALRNNAIIWTGIAVVYGLIVNSELVAIYLTIVCVVGVAALTVWEVQKFRKKRAGKPKKLEQLHFRNLRVKGPAPDKVTIPAFQAAGELVDEKPVLTSGIPTTVMATLLAQPLGVSAIETAGLLTIGDDRGTLRLPDTFAALTKQRETVQEIIAAQTKGTVAFSWRTSETPRIVTWVPVVRSLPRMVHFTPYIDRMEKLAIGDFGVGVTFTGDMYVSSHNGERPWHLRSADSGTGKSTGFQVKLAQICHQDPTAEVYCIDTKQVSFQDMKGIPNVHVFDDPVRDMGKIWKVFFSLEQLMRDRYDAVHRREARYEDFTNIWLLVDEGNDLQTQLRSYYDQHVKGTGDPATPTVWTPVASLLNLGRQVGFRGEWMFQNMTDKSLGGVNLRDSWQAYGMAGYNKNQWMRIIGTPMPPPLHGAGRIMMVRGNEETWVQGFYDEPEVLRAYAMANR